LLPPPLAADVIGLSVTTVLTFGSLRWVFDTEDVVVVQ
jgi:hypothetical protein